MRLRDAGLSNLLFLLAPVRVLTAVSAVHFFLAAGFLTAQVKITSSQPAIVRNGEGFARFYLANPGTTPQPLALTSGFFIDETSHSRIEQPTVKFLAEAGGALPATLASGQRIEVVAPIGGLAGTLSAEAPLFNNGQRIGSLVAVAVDTALNVSLDGAGTADHPLPFTYRRSAVIPLKNSGKDYLLLDWRVLVGGTQEGVGTITLPPGGGARIVLTPTSDVYSPVDFFRPSTKTGVLLLRPHTEPAVDPRLFDLHPLQLTLVMNRLGPEATQFLFALYVMFFLFLGGALSLLANSILPNIQRRITFEKQVASLADRTSSLSNRVDSYLRVLLRLERKEIQYALREATWYSLSIGERVEAVAADIAKLDKRLTVTERLDELLRRFEEISGSAPPSATDAIDQTLLEAAEQLHTFALTDDVVNAANSLLGKAAAQMDDLDDTAAQAKRVAAGFTELKTRLAVFPPEFYGDLQNVLAGIFKVLDEPFDDPTKIVAPMLFAIDHAIAAAQIALDYAMVRATIPNAGTPECPDPGKPARERLVEHECRLLHLLGTLSWKALREARILVRQMRENVYEEDIIEALEEGQREHRQVAKIVFDMQRARPYLPIYFSLAFDNPRFKNAAALNCLAFRWKFPGELYEEGAKVCHYFIGNELALKEASVPEEIAPEAKPVPRRPKREGGPLAWLQRKWRARRERARRRRYGFTTGLSVRVQRPNAPATCSQIQDQIRIGPRKARGRSRTFVEIMRFLIAFGVALAGIEAGALDQLRKLDFLAGTIAVIALGFGADSIKNLLAQGPRKTA